MKQTLLSILFVASVALYAQPNLKVSLDSPINGATISAGVPFTFGITINNTGNAGHLGFPSDTVIYWPLFNGSPLGNGQGGTVAWYMSDPLAAGSNTSRTQTLTVQGGSSGNLTICAYIRMGGASYTGFVRDTTDNCAGVTYNSAMSVTDFQIQETFDNSFYNNGTYYVQISSARTLVNPKLEILDISGRMVKQVLLQSEGGEASENVSVQELPHGMYFARLSTDKGLISVVKFTR